MQEQAERVEDLKISIRELFLNEVQSELVHASVGSFIVKTKKKATIEELSDTIHWLNAFSCQEVAEYKAIRKLVKDEIWENYKMLGLKDLVEVKMLRDAKKKMVSKWRKRPITIRRVEEWVN